MKIFITVSAVLGILISACTKTDIDPSKAVAGSSIDEATILKTRSSLLVAHPWMYQEYDFHYVDQHHRGDIQYLRGGTNNVIDLDETRITFRKDGTCVELDGGFKYHGTWHFSDNTATLLIVDFTNWVDEDSILVLNNNHLKYTEPMGYHDKSYTELITAQ